jgi:adenylate kinase family enzyme
VRRVSVVGNSGSGKTTLAIGLARALGAAHLELDAVFHLPGWQPLEAVLFRARVAEFIVADSWVVDGNYSTVQDLVWRRADTVIWLDLPRRVVMAQLLRRTLGRMVTGAELWNGNTEDWRSLLKADPGQSILRWAWTQHHIYRARYLAAQHDPANQHLTFIRLPSRSAAARFVAGLPSHPAARPAGAEAGGPEAGGTVGE